MSEQETSLDDLKETPSERGGYRDTSLGQLPEAWEVRKLGVDFSIKYGDEKRENELQENGFPVYGANGVIGYSENYLYKDPVLTVTCRGATCGNIHLTQPESWVTNNSLVLQDDEDINKRFLADALRHHSVERAISGSAQPQITASMLSKMPYPLPPREEQRKIASVLYTIDQAIQKTEEIINQLRRTKLGLSQRLFSRGAESHSQFKSTKYGQIPEEWDVKKLSEVSTQIQAGGTPDTDVPGYYGGSIPWIKTGELSQSRITETETNITQEGLDNSSAHLFEPGTVLIAMYGATTGEVALLEIEAASNQACCGVVTISQFSSVFLYHQLKYLSDHLESLSAGSGQQNIGKGIIENFDILVPSISEQDAIAGILNVVDEMIMKNKGVKQSLQRLKKGNMQDLLSGEVRTHDKDIEVVDEVLAHG